MKKYTVDFKMRDGQEEMSITVNDDDLLRLQKELIKSKIGGFLQIHDGYFINLNEVAAVEYYENEKYS